MVHAVAASRSYRHCDNEVGLSLLEAAQLGNYEGCQIGDECLDNEDDGNHGELSQLLGGQLRRQLGEDCSALLAYACYHAPNGCTH